MNSPFCNSMLLKISLFLILLFNFNNFTFSQNNNIQYEEKLYNSLEWRNIGPFRGGRSCAVAGVPGKPNLFYFGATGGGVWKTTNGGRNWENISDGFFGGSIGAIAVSEYDPNVIYVGGGENTVRGNVSSGSGMWKSEDAGKTWQAISDDLDDTPIYDIVFHPEDSNILFAGTVDRGVLRSTDGGDSWQQFALDGAHVWELEIK